VLYRDPRGAHRQVCFLTCHQRGVAAAQSGPRRVGGRIADEGAGEMDPSPARI